MIHECSCKIWLRHVPDECWCYMWLHTCNLEDELSYYIRVHRHYMNILHWCKNTTKPQNKKPNTRKSYCWVSWCPSWRDGALQASPERPVWSHACAIDACAAVPGRWQAWRRTKHRRCREERLWAVSEEILLFQTNNHWKHTVKHMLHLDASD